MQPIFITPRFLSQNEVNFEQELRKRRIEFEFDVFVSQAAEDSDKAREIAHWLRSQGLRVWFDEWQLQLGDDTASKTEHALEHSQVMVLCMSAHAFSSAWAMLESGTLRFRDPLNKKRRFVALRLDDAEIPAAVAQVEHIDWLREDRQRAQAKLLQVCRATELLNDASDVIEKRLKKAVHLNYRYNEVRHYAFSSDGRHALIGGTEQNVHLWDLKADHCETIFAGHEGSIRFVAWSPDERLMLSGADDKTLRVWDVDTGRCLSVLNGHDGPVLSVDWNADGRRALSSSSDGTVRLWDTVREECLLVLEGHEGAVCSAQWSRDQKLVLSASSDRTVRIWDLATNRCVRVLEGHTDEVLGVRWNFDQSFAVSCSRDSTVRIWEVESGRCLRVLEGHTKYVGCLVTSIHRNLVLSGSGDQTMRLWDIVSGRCLEVFRGLRYEVNGAGWSADQRYAFSGDSDGRLCIWDVSELLDMSEMQASLGLGQVDYTNAKVLLVGDTSSGKTALAHRLATGRWRPSEASTVGAWSTQWKLTDDQSHSEVEREIWIWDFGGQADQRLIHQLYMEDTALAALVFDGQKENLFETLGQWDRDITRATGKDLSKLLVVGRIDAGGLRISRSQLADFAKERGFLRFVETSAMMGTGCDDLRQAIIDGINWKDIPWRSSPLLFKKLKDEIIHLKDQGRVLMRVSELRDLLQLRLFGEIDPFTEAELRAVVGLLAGPGIVWELKFGSWVLLQPERINAYAQAVIQTMREDEEDRGCVLEERVLSGDLTYFSSADRLHGSEERFILLAVHQTLIERGLCFREHSDHGPLLIFPSYYRRERPELVSHPAVLVSYRFDGFLDDIYATLVVRLHHTSPYNQDQLWRYAADFRTLTKKQLGIKLTRLTEGAGELQLYFEQAVSMEEKIIFSKYVHEHLLQRARNVVRLRRYVCPHCGTPANSPEIASKRLDDWLQNRKPVAEAPSIVCLECEKRIPLWDDMEQCFASSEIQQLVSELQKQSDVVLDGESKERVLVGEVISTVALAGQICREHAVSDHGIDLEIEFKLDDGRATGRKVYAQLKSGDSYLKKRKRDGAEIFIVRKERHVEYWRQQAFPVLLLIRNSEGEIRWMDVREYLQRRPRSKKPVRLIEFQGQRFDVMSIRRLRDAALGGETL